MTLDEAVREIRFNLDQFAKSMSSKFKPDEAEEEWERRIAFVANEAIELIIAKPRFSGAVCAEVRKFIAQCVGGFDRCEQPIVQSLQ